MSFYADPANLFALDLAMDYWEGTRYSRLGTVPGPLGGIGCVRLILELNTSTEAVAPVPADHIPEYPDDWGRHHRNSLLEPWLHQHGFLIQRAPETEIPDPCKRIADGAKATVIRSIDETQAGDICLFAPSATRCVHHIAQLRPRTLTLYHSLKGHGVCETTWTEPAYPGTRRQQTVADLFTYALRLR